MIAEEYIKENCIGRTTNIEPYYFRFDLQQLRKTLQDFAKLKCKEQKEIILDMARWGQFDRDIILNSPEPEL